MPLSAEISNKLVASLIRRKVRQQLNEVLADLKREYGTQFEHAELHEIAMETLKIMRDSSVEFIDDMEKRFKSGEVFRGSGGH